MVLVPHLLPRERCRCAICCRTQRRAVLVSLGRRPGHPVRCVDRPHLYLHLVLSHYPFRLGRIKLLVSLLLLHASLDHARWLMSLNFDNRTRPCTLVEERRPRLLRRPAIGADQHPHRRARGRQCLRSGNCFASRTAAAGPRAVSCGPWRPRRPAGPYWGPVAARRRRRIPLRIPACAELVPLVRPWPSPGRIAPRPECCKDEHELALMDISSARLCYFFFSPSRDIFGVGRHVAAPHKGIHIDIKQRRRAFMIFASGRDPLYGRPWCVAKVRLKRARCLGGVAGFPDGQDSRSACTLVFRYRRSAATGSNPPSSSRVQAADSDCLMVNWISNVVRSPQENTGGIPPFRGGAGENLWIKCPESGQLVFSKTCSEASGHPLRHPGFQTTTCA